ncbi:MAG: terminase large subunit domain-containing protein [Candidatus Hecatellaceae archaeon]
MRKAEGEPPPNVRRALVKARDNPVFFARWLLDLKPTSYQERFLSDPSRRVVLRWCRQSGKTLSLAVKALWFALFHPGVTVLLIAPSLRQSLHLKGKVDWLLARLPEDAQWLMVERNLRDSVRLWGGSRLLALPANPETLRGYTAHMVVVDEAEFFREPEKLFYGVLYPMLTATDGYLLVASTPWSSQGFFHQLCQPGSGFSQHLVTWREAVAEGVASQDFIEEAKRRLPPEIFQREYECRFAEDASVFLPGSLLTRCVDPELKLLGLEEKPAGEFYVGVDLGKHQDYSVVAVAERLENLIRLIHVHVFPLETPYASIVGYVKALASSWQSTAGILVDATGVGEYVAEDLAEALPNLEPVKFTQQVKVEMAFKVKQAMAAGKISIPYDYELLRQLSVERLEVSRDGSLRLTHPEGVHDDVFWAFILAVYGALKGGGETSILPAPKI